MGARVQRITGDMIYIFDLLDEIRAQLVEFSNSVKESYEKQNLDSEQLLHAISVVDNDAYSFLPANINQLKELATDVAQTGEALVDTKK